MRLTALLAVALVGAASCRSDGGTDGGGSGGGASAAGGGGGGTSAAGGGGGGATAGGGGAGGGSAGGGSGRCTSTAQCNPITEICDLDTELCVCNPVSHLCSGRCSSNYSPTSCAASCTACPQPANATATCGSAMTCGWDCNTGFHACGATCGANDSTNTCGSSCTPCTSPANAAAICDGGACGFRCNTGFHTCTPGSCSANSAVATCGSACLPCTVPANAAGATCDGGACGFVCSGGFHQCGSACSANASTDSCGGACLPCEPPAHAAATCDGGACGHTCEVGFTACGNGRCCAGAAMSISSSRGFSCAVSTQGLARCWGSNTQGQLGNGFPGPSAFAPVDVEGLSSGVQAIVTGDNHACALVGGAVKCWGDGNDGEFGAGTATRASSVPVDTLGLDAGVVGLVAGGSHTCALMTGGRVKCWGDDSSGAVGDGMFQRRYLPVDVVGLDAGVSALAAGTDHTCALTLQGGVKCWGTNGLGIGSGAFRAPPTDVQGLGSGVLAIAAGGDSSCAVLQSGGVKCWGSNGWGQLGDGFMTDRLAPVDVVGLTGNATGVTIGPVHACARSSTGGLSCWGRGTDGQLGNGLSMSSVVPVGVTGLSSGATAVSAGDYMTCALAAGGVLQCWGQSGAIGDGTQALRPSPAAVLF